MAPSTTTMKRIRREMADIQKEDLGNITLAPLEDNMHIWRGTIPGPEGSVYEGGVFHVEIALPNDYPFSAPKAMLKTRIYHMNISEQGSICIDILKNNWSPALSLFKVMLSLSSLLTDPNPRDPLVPSIATEYMRNRKAHDTKARQWTEMYAKPKPAAAPKPQAPPAPQPAPPSLPIAGQISPGRSSRLRRAAAAAAPPTAGSSSSLGHPRASAISSSSLQAGPSRPHSQTTSGASTPIVIDDSDDEGNGNSRNRARASTSRSKRKRGEESSQGANAGAGSSRANRRNVVAVLDISDEDADGSGSGSAGSSSGRSKRARTGRAPATALHSDDVIVIED